MKVNLGLSAENLDEETAQSLTRELYATICKETDFDVSLGEQKSVAGSRGDVVTVGQIVIAVLGTGGGAVALLNVFRSFFERSKELTIKVKNQGGDEIEISSKNVDDDEVRSMLNRVLAKD